MAFDLIGNIVVTFCLFTTSPLLNSVSELPRYATSGSETVINVHSQFVINYAEIKVMLKV